jgi:hypothetical protein
MNDTELKKKLKSVAGSLLYNKQFIAPVDLLIGLGYLTQKNYEAWRNGSIPFLERACSANLHRLSRVMKLLRNYAKDQNLDPSRTAYLSWGNQNNKKLRFSKTGKPFIEEAYATHYLRKKSINSASEIDKKGDNI